MKYDKTITKRKGEKEMPERLLNDVETAELLNMSPFTLRNWRTQGRGPKWVTLGRAVRYNPKDIARFIEQSTIRDHAEVVCR